MSDHFHDAKEKKSTDLNKRKEERNETSFDKEMKFGRGDGGSIHLVQSAGKEKQKVTCIQIQRIRIEYSIVRHTIEEKRTGWCMVNNEGEKEKNIREKKLWEEISYR